MHSFRNTTTTSQRGMGVVGGKSTSQQHNFTPWTRGRGVCGRGRVVSRPTAATTCPLCANSPPAHQIWHRKNDDIKERKKNHPNAAFEPANNAHHNNAYFYFLSNIKYFKIKLVQTCKWVTWCKQCKHCPCPCPLLVEAVPLILSCLTCRRAPSWSVPLILSCLTCRRASSP